MNSPNTWLTVGKLVSAQGLRGEVRIQPTSDFPERFTEPGKRWLQQQAEEPKEIELISGRKLPGKSLYALKFGGIDNRDQAESIIGERLLVKANDRPKLSDGEFHFLDLVGLAVQTNTSEEVIGHVTNLIAAGNDLLEITLLDDRNVLVPFVKAIVPEVNLKEGWLMLTPPPGLMDL